MLGRCCFAFAVCAGSFFAHSSLAVDESSLWLPKKFQKYYVALIKAAESAESVDRCVSVLEATIDLDQSHEKHPIFRILCRQDNGRSYNEMVDGLSFSTLTTIKPAVVELSPEALEKLRLQQEAAEQERISALKTSLWQACQSEVEKEAYLMNGLTWLSDSEQEPLSFSEQNRQPLEDESDKSQENVAIVSATIDEMAVEESAAESSMVDAVFAIDFDAQTLSGEKLHYRALCNAANYKMPSIEIKKR